MSQNNQVLNNLPESVLKELLISKSKFLGQLAHNLKNPIGSGLSFSEMVLEDYESYSPEKLKRHLSIIKGSCEAALEQLEVLLIESKIETNTLDLYLQETLFSKHITTIIEQNEKSFSKTNIKIDCFFLENEPKIKIDKALINHVLQSIFLFYIQNSTNTNLEIHLKRQSNYIEFTISNKNSCECTEKYNDLLQHTIQPTNSLFSSTINKHLSLKSSIEIAKLHQGELNFSISENDSIKFKLSLPVSL